VVGVPEFNAPKVGTRSSLVTIDTELKSDSAGVLYALGAFSGGLALWVEKGTLSYEYNLFEIQRTRIDTSGPLPTGKVKIEIDSRLEEQRHSAPMDVVIRVNGQEVAKGRVPVTASLTFTANDTFDVGMDSYSPVSLAYFDRAPFKFNGKIDLVRVAGNIANDDILGSMEFACKVAGAKVVLVMGHTACGAIKGAIDKVQLGKLTGLLAKIRPAVEATRYQGERSAKNYDFVDAVVRKNVELTMADIRKRSAVLADLEASGAIKIVGAM
jgi:hypothetical protein